MSTKGSENEFRELFANINAQIAAGTISAENGVGLIAKAASLLAGEGSQKESAGELLAQERAEKSEPWLRSRRIAASNRDSIRKQIRTKGERHKASLQKAFVASAELGKLSPAEIFYAAYTIFSEDVDEDTTYMHTLVKSVAPDKLVLEHNWMLFENFDEHDQRRYGPVVEHLRVPLFPVAEGDEGLRLHVLNQRILEEEEARLRDGHHELLGGSLSDQLLSCQRGIFGGGYMAPVYNEEGQQTGVADLSDVEAFMVRVSERVDKLSTQPSCQALIEEIRRCLREARTPTAMRKVEPRFGSTGYSGPAPGAGPSGHGGRGGGKRGGHSGPYYGGDAPKN